MKVSLFCFLLLVIGHLESQTIIPDSSLISGNWALSGSPYIVKGRAIIPSGQTLTIDPGVHVRFSSSTNLANAAVWDPDTNVVGSIRVYGAIIANGTATDTISFSSDGSGCWGSIFMPWGSPGGNAFSYCKMSGMYRISGNNSFLGITEYYSGLYYEVGDSLNLTHMLFENNEYALQTGPAATSGMSVTVGNSVFRNNIDNYGNPNIPLATLIQGEAYVYNSVFDHSTLSGENLTIVNCILMNADSFAILPYSTAIMSCRIVNSLLYNNPRAFHQAHQMFIYNTVFLDNSGYASVFCCGNALNNSVFDGPIVGSWSVTTVNYPSTNPSLVNPLPVGGNFHPLSSSICLNNGDTTGLSALIPNTDLDGNPRYNGIIDIGPYEYQGATQIHTDGPLNLNIFPNPNRGEFVLSINEPGKINVEVTDVMGSCVPTINEHISPNDYVLIKGLAEGIYFARISLNSKPIRIEKIIVTK